MSKEAKHAAAYGTVAAVRDKQLKKGHRPIIGIDIGSSTIKIVRMKKNNRISRFGIETIPEGMMNQGRIEAPKQLAELIRNMLKKYRIRGRRCSLCLTGSEIIVRELKLPEMSDSQIIENIKHEITSFLPLNHDEYCIDYKVLEYYPPTQQETGKLRIMAAAVPNSIVNSYIATLKKANLKVTYVDVIPNIAGKLTKWIRLNCDREKKFNNVGIIDFGAHTTNIILIKDGNYYVHKTINSGGDYLTSQISEKLNVDFMEAEAFKKKANFFENSFRDNEYLLVKNIIDFILTDIGRTMEFYRNRNNQTGIDRIYIMGGGSLLKGLREYIMEHLNIEVSYLSDMLQHCIKSPDNQDVLTYFPQAIGATLREE